MSDVAEALGMSAPPPATPALPDSDAIAKMSPAQAQAKLTELGAQKEWCGKLFAGDGQAAKLFSLLNEKRFEAELAEQIVAAAADPSAPPPAAGGALNRSSMSPADEVTAAKWQFETGASLDEVLEWEGEGRMVSPEDFAILERQFDSRCLRNPQWVQKLLTGDPDARLTLDRWKRIVITSRPLPPIPTTGIAR